MNLKKIHVKELMLLLIILVGLKFGINTIYNSEWFTHPEYITYAYNVASIEKLTINQFEDLLKSSNNKNINVIYVGRKTCPTCIELLPAIKNAFSTITETNISSYYFDSEKYDVERTNTLREKIGVKTVPSIIIINEHNITIFNSSDISSADFEKVFYSALHDSNIKK